MKHSAALTAFNTALISSGGVEASMHNQELITFTFTVHASWAGAPPLCQANRGAFETRHSHLDQRHCSRFAQHRL